MQELERRGQADVGDRRRVAADERPSGQEERAEDLEWAGEGRFRVALRLRLRLVVDTRVELVAFGSLRRSEYKSKLLER